MTATCRAGRHIDTGQAPTFIHTDDDTECDHGRDAIPAITLTTVRDRLAAIHSELDNSLDGDGDRQYAAERTLYALGDLLNDITASTR